MGTIYNRIQNSTSIMQKISKSLEELVQEKLLSKKADVNDPNSSNKVTNTATSTPATPTVPNPTPNVQNNVPNTQNVATGSTTQPLIDRANAFEQSFKPGIQPEATKPEFDTYTTKNPNGSLTQTEIKMQNFPEGGQMLQKIVSEAPDSTSSFKTKSVDHYERTPGNGSMHIGDTTTANPKGVPIYDFSKGVKGKPVISYEGNKEQQNKAYKLDVTKPKSWGDGLGPKDKDGNPTNMYYRYTRDPNGSITGTIDPSLTPLVFGFGQRHVEYPNGRKGGSTGSFSLNSSQGATLFSAASPEQQSVAMRMTGNPLYKGIMAQQASETKGMDQNQLNAYRQKQIDAADKVYNATGMFNYNGNYGRNPSMMPNAESSSANIGSTDYSGLDEQGNPVAQPEKVNQDNTAKDSSKGTGGMSGTPRTVAQRFNQKSWRQKNPQIGIA